MDEQSLEFVGAKEACELLGVTRQTLDNYVKRGMLTRYELRAPKRTMYRRSAIMALKQPRPKQK